ncbi:DUF7882 family protein [Clavibacter michiganensis]|uniref:DUF7882 family protein n=1 Tax=Clavibacter michiganensis TaxID=28447 RepID=UPI000D52A81D|nr:ATP-dependent DNA ligase [Clavibacter michiganensis]AWF99954.1 hypothetical protein BEH61_15720 [Clavibacter michiganensis subsp. insidiosus]
MGRLTYDSSLDAVLDDRLLAHLQIVIGAKLRRRESFFMTWEHDVAAGSGRTTLWLHSGVPLGFEFLDPRVPEVNRAWIDALMRLANSAEGLRICSEPREAR